MRARWREGSRPSFSFLALLLLTLIIAPIGRAGAVATDTAYANTDPQPNRPARGVSAGGVDRDRALDLAALGVELVCR